jgi:hypothetical protein
MKYSLAILLLSLFCSSIYAQVENQNVIYVNHQDVVYLKNGGILKGNIIELIPNKSVKIEITGGSVFIFKIDEILKITKEPLNDQSENQKSRKTHYGTIVEIGYQLGVSKFGQERLKVNLIRSLDYNETISTGLGAGLRYYSISEKFLIPVFVDLRANFNSNNEISPYIATHLGYTFSTEDLIGWYFEPNVGIRADLSDKLAMNLGFGYELQRMEVGSSTVFDPIFNYNRNVITIENVGAISLNVAILF